MTINTFHFQTFIFKVTEMLIKLIYNFETVLLQISALDPILSHAKTHAKPMQTSIFLLNRFFDSKIREIRDKNDIIFHYFYGLRFHFSILKISKLTLLISWRWVQAFPLNKRNSNCNCSKSVNRNINCGQTSGGLNA